MELQIKLSTDNAAFSPNVGLEASRILGIYANSIKDILDFNSNTWELDTSFTWELETTLKDLNGNKVGTVVYKSN